MIGRLNHVGVAVPSIDEAKATYRDLYGVPESEMTETRELAAQGVKFAFVNVANSQIELIEPLGEDSPIRNFLAKNPSGGQHHVCFEVEDIYAARDEMVVRGPRC
ncbi:MAG: VOC family protein [Hyphomonadaceae bacterium]